MCTTLTISTSAQEQKNDSSKQDRDRAEKNTAPFSMDYFNKPGNSYLVMTLQVDDGKLVVNENTRVQEVKGKMPYPSGNLNVKLIDQKGEVVNQYQMQDPLILRSCEDEKSELKPIQKGNVQIMLPRNGNVASIELSRGKETIQRVNVKDVIERYHRGSNDPNNKEGQ